MFCIKSKATKRGRRPPKRKLSELASDDVSVASQIAKLLSENQLVDQFTDESIEHVIKVYGINDTLL